MRLWPPRLPGRRARVQGDDVLAMTKERRHLEIERVDRELQDTGDGRCVLVRAELVADLASASGHGHRPR
jgi:hypothetical protein